jgi:RNA polymerase sigma-70 factor (ECF subfamily)
MDLSKKQEEKLVQGCIKNDRTAQEKLYKVFHADMLRVCYTYLPNKELAKEAFNQGFFKVFQSIHNFNTEQGALGGWIRKIMIFTSIDLARKEMKFNSTSDLENVDDDNFIPPAVLEKLYFEDILQKIRLLPPSAQMVFNLYVIDGFTHKEISEELNISEGTSRWHLADAKRKLREWMGPYDGSTDQPKERREKAK